MHGRKILGSVVPFFWVCSVHVGILSILSSSFVAGFSVNNHANVGGCSHRRTTRNHWPWTPNPSCTSLSTPKKHRSRPSSRLHAWSGEDDNGDDNNNEEDFDFNAAFSARKDTIEGGQAGIKSRAVTRKAMEFKDETEDEIRQFAGKKIKVVNIVFPLVALAVIGFFVSISLGPFLKDDDTTYDEKGDPIVKVTKKDLKNRPKAQVVDLNDLLKDSVK